MTDEVRDLCERLRRDGQRDNCDCYVLNRYAAADTIERLAAENERKDARIAEQARRIEDDARVIARLRALPRWQRSKCNEYPECSHRACRTDFVWADDLDKALRATAREQQK